MSKQSASTEKIATKQQTKPQPTVEPLAGIAEFAGESLLIGAQSLQADRLGNPSIPAIQRQLLAGQIGHTYGNRNFQQTMASLKRESSEVPRQQNKFPQPVSDVLTQSKRIIGGQSTPYKEKIPLVSEHIYPSETQVQLGKIAVSTIQARRVPDVNAAEDILTDLQVTETASSMNFSFVDAPNYAAHRDGILRIISLAREELTNRERRRVRNRVLNGLTQQEYDVLPNRDKLLRALSAILEVAPRLRLGDPRLRNSSARAGTQDRANLITLVSRANPIFTALYSGRYDVNIANVFGTHNVGNAKAKYVKAQIWLNRLYAQNKILSDRSGFSEETDIGATTVFQKKIVLSPSVIDNPNNRESISTTIHESMHAGNQDVDDKGYINEPGFTKLSEDIKLTNAAHFEVVPRRILEIRDRFRNEIFTPADSVNTSGNIQSTWSQQERAMRESSERIRDAWDRALNLHNLYLSIFTTPTEWNILWKDVVPFWSKVENLTIHKKTQINPQSVDPSIHPVSLIDIALSEGVMRKLAHAALFVPKKESELVAFKRKYATREQLTQITTLDTEINLIIRLILEKFIGKITGEVDRDMRAINVLAQTTDPFQKRNPNDFAD